MSNQWRFNTKAVHAGQVVDPATGARAVPIYQTTSYNFRDADHAAALFGLEEEGYIYSRIMNPTVDAFEKRVAALEGGVGALATSSGLAAISLAIMNIAGAGDEFVSSSSLYGGTHTLFGQTLRRFGINAKFVDTNDPENYRQAVTPKTKCFFLETIGNPQINIPDIEAIAKVAHEVGVPLLVDNTFATPYLCRPLEFGADIVIHSATKFIGGHGTTIGGVIIDGGKFDWQNGRFPGLVEPDPSYHDVSYVEKFGAAAYIVKTRVTLLRDLGPCLSPFNAFLLLQGLESLHLRMERHVSNALAVAQFLQNHPQVVWVSYPSLPGDPSYPLAQKYTPKGAGAILAFGVKGGRDAGRKVVNQVKLCSLLANVGDAKTLIIHPASTTHQQLSPEQQRDAGVKEDLIRLSVGIEDVQDIIEDLDQALKAI